jgi:hypothetical protein
VVATVLLRNLRLLKPTMTKESTMTETTIDLPGVIANSDGETGPWPQMRPRKRVERVSP